MTTTRTCMGRKEGGAVCLAAPLRESGYCLFHDPDHAETVQRARVKGGKRRRTEAAVATIYDFTGLDTIEDIRRLVEVAVYDALRLPTSLGRARTLAYLAHHAMTLLEKGEMEERVAALEEAVGPRLVGRGRG
jgi:hypothetical protein